MDTKDLRFFRQVYETGSINKASRQLFITPQGLSKVIRHLEEELQADLFQRSANGMVPTESGRYLYDNCGSLLEQFDALTLEIRQLRDRNRKLGIGFSCGVLNVFPFQKMETYKKQYSQITLQWEESSKAPRCAGSNHGPSVPLQPYRHSDGTQECNSNKLWYWCQI